MTQGEQTPLIRDLYVPVLRRIMDEHRIAYPVAPPGHVVEVSASFDEVVRNTAWYCWLADERPHYRYRRYLEVLRRIRLPPGDYRVVHLDIGCGAGLFSWAFLDWARNSHVACERVALYGFDHSPEMTNLAYQMRNRLTQSVPDYPDLRYACDAETLLHDLTQAHQNGTIYIITFGHVLVQAKGSDDIARFVRIISDTLRLGAGSHGVLVAVDAKGWPTPFAHGWGALLASLTAAGIDQKRFSVARTSINDDDRAKVAVLTPAGKQEVR